MIILKCICVLSALFLNSGSKDGHLGSDIFTYSKGKREAISVLLDLKANEKSPRL